MLKNTHTHRQTHTVLSWLCVYINIGIDATITIKVLFSSGWLVPSGAGPESEQVSLEKLFLVVVCVMEENVTFVYLMTVCSFAKKMMMK